MFLLDTNICIYIIKRQPPQVIQKLRTFEPKEIKLSVMTVCEMAWGAKKSGSVKNKLQLENFIKPFDVLPLDEECIWHYAKLRTDLQAKGQPIGSVDMFIAAHALALDATLVTNNTKEFARIPDLKLENWV